MNLYLFKGGEETENEFTLWGTNISHLGKRNIIFKIHFSRDMFVPRRVAIYTWDESSYSELCSGILAKVFDNMCQGRSTPKILGTYWGQTHPTVKKQSLYLWTPKPWKMKGLGPKDMGHNCQKWRLGVPMVMGVETPTIGSFISRTTFPSRSNYAAPPRLCVSDVYRSGAMLGDVWVDVDHRFVCFSFFTAFQVTMFLLEWCRILRKLGETPRIHHQHGQSIDRCWS